MRAPLAVIIAFAAPLGLTACATGRTPPTYQQELDQLQAECTARGGILAPTGHETGRPQTEFVCKITGGASRIPQY
ncbi:hypothetical protein D8I30_04010 [Brevundimonas naejangsanensis]|uniref:Lipoprotein n=1 Tax=Brevundimonas naejangsanensis TaxID=588932 RepID=A0A494RE45_9CAUL|nr:hypothetical protein [Brevundimonas naejangsanensis]AYG94441.1 hypothetical protein D8I30_04010 [Brevundimonas naejangsanensis]